MLGVDIGKNSIAYKMNLSIYQVLIAIASFPSAFSFLGITEFFEGGQFQKDDIRIDGKVVIITGGNSGIGYETALDLAKRGAILYLACRDVGKAEVAKQTIINQSRNPDVYVGKLDLASFESIYHFVTEFKKREPKLHILINNAGVAGIPERQLTEDGLEMQIGINHFGHFLLTKLLLDTLKGSAPARIVVVSSSAHFLGSIHQDDLQLEKSYSRYEAYFQSKLANILFTRELAKRLNGTGVTVNSLHPGVVDTDVFNKLSAFDQIIAVPSIFRKTPKSGAQTSIMLAVDPDVANVTGRYFADCAIATESSAAQNDETAAWLWQESERIIQPFLQKHQLN